MNFLMGEFKKSGIRLSKKDAAGLADRLFAHSGTVGNRAGAVLQSKHALGTLSAIRPWSNPLMMEGLKNDPTGQGMQAMAVVDSSMRFIPQAYIAARQAIWMNQAKRYAKELNKLDEQLSSGSLPEKRYRKYEKKQATYQRKDMALRGKRQAAAEKAKKKEAAYQARKDKLKKPGEYLKKQAKNGLKKAESGIKRLPGGTYATRVANRAAKVNSFAMKRALSGASRVFETHAKFHALVTKLILWFAGRHVPCAYIFWDHFSSSGTARNAMPVHSPIYYNRCERNGYTDSDRIDLRHCISVYAGNGSKMGS